MSTTQLHALLVEDEPSICAVYQTIFSSFDISLTIVHDGDHALSALSQLYLGGLPLDLLITDHNHRGVRGIDLIRKVCGLPDEWTLRGGLRIRHIPIILQSGVASTLQAEDLRKTVPFLEKPYKIQELLHTMDRVLRQYREEILQELHYVGLAITWKAGQLRISPCYALDKRKALESKHFVISNWAELDKTASAYCKLLLLEDRQWSAEIAIAEFESLINSPRTVEHDFQRFFRLHPEFLYQTCFIDHWAEPHLRDRESGKVYKPDFILKAMALPDRPWAWQVVDLKRHNVPVLANKHFHEDFSHYIQRAITQLRDYSQYFVNPANRDDIEDKFGASVLRPKLTAVIGRLPKQTEVSRFAELRERILDVSITTYDEILEIRRSRIEFQKAFLQTRT